MVDAYRNNGIFAHEDPVRAVAERVQHLSPAGIHAMHGATIAGEALPYCTKAPREQCKIGRVGAAPSRGDALIARLAAGAN